MSWPDRPGRDGAFLVKGLKARDALLEPDIELDGPPDEESSEEPFDEYRLLAALTLVGMDLSLLHELPILHVIGVLRRLNMLQDTERKHYRPLTDKEMSNLYPAAQEKSRSQGRRRRMKYSVAALSLHGRIRRGIWRQSQLMTLSYT